MNDPPMAQNLHLFTSALSPGIPGGPQRLRIAGMMFAGMVTAMLALMSSGVRDTLRSYRPPVFDEVQRPEFSFFSSEIVGFHVEFQGSVPVPD